MILASSVSVFLALMLFWSAVPKLRYPAIFSQVLAGYSFGPIIQKMKLGSVVPLAEVAVGICLLLPRRGARTLGCIAFICFLAIGSAAIFSRLRRGDAIFVCGCSTDLEEKTPASAMLMRNGLLLSCALYVVAARMPAGFTDYAIAVSLLLAFDLVNAALIQEGRVQAWKADG